MSKEPYEEALEIIERGADPGLAYPYLLAAMEAGDYRAHYAVGTWYLFGRHVKKNVKSAVKLLRLAAENGVAEAAYDLAVCYEKGEGVRKNLQKSVSLYLRALRLGDAAAAEELRRMFYWGIGVEKNRAVADEFGKYSL